MSYSSECIFTQLLQTAICCVCWHGLVHESEDLDPVLLLAGLWTSKTADQGQYLLQILEILLCHPLQGRLLSKAHIKVREVAQRAQKLWLTRLHVSSYAATL